MLEIESLAQFDAHGDDLRGVALQALDLTARTDALLAAQVEGAVFLGCRLEAKAQHHVIDAGGLVFPPLEGLPYSAFRGGLYRVEELYEGFDPDHPESYAETLDGRVYEHWRASGGAHPPSILETLARRLHDHGITDAMEEFLVDAKVVAIMGGHSMSRTDPMYRDVARIAGELTRAGFMMATGGGPGAMEATHLGAYFSARPDQLDAALQILAEAPKYTDDRWLSCAFAVRRAFPPDETQSLGIPTWLYGHEPPNPFASHIAKYFANSIREEGLLAIAQNGVVFSPGSAGTIQEIFQDACQNHYVTTGMVSPMVFLSTEYWTKTKPIYPLLESLAADQAYGRWLSITDRPEEVVERLQAFASEREG